MEYPTFWQQLAFDHFVAKRPPGDRFNRKDVASWVLRSFHHERALYRLFVTQYAKRAEARRAGFSKRRLDYWVFTEEENERIANFYAPTNEFIDRLEALGLVQHLASPIGECEVLPHPAAGRPPVAFGEV